MSQSAQFTSAIGSTAATMLETVEDSTSQALISISPFTLMWHALFKKH